MVFGAELRVQHQTRHRLSRIIREAIRYVVGDVRCRKRQRAARMEVERAIRDPSRGPGLQLQPAVRAHQESAYWWAIHNAVLQTFQPVVVPADALRMEVEDSIGTEVHFTGLRLAG